jgi:CBS domain-containing protein
MRTWQVGDVMTTDVATVGEQTPYRGIVEVLTGRRIGAVPVVDDFGRVPERPGRTGPGLLGARPSPILAIACCSPGPVSSKRPPSGSPRSA